VERGTLRQPGGVVVRVDREHPGQRQVRDAERGVARQGRARLAEVREGAQAAPLHRQDPQRLHRGLEVQGDEGIY